MSFFSRLFKANPPPPAPILHDGLGELIGSRALNGDVCSWETALPVDTPIGALKVSIEGGHDGPTQQHFELWEAIAENLAQLRVEANPFLEGWLDQIEPETSAESLSPARIYVWEETESEPEWSLIFLHAAKLWEFTVTFVGMNADHTDFDRL